MELFLREKTNYISQFLSGFLLFVLIINSVLFAFLATPQKAHAQMDTQITLLTGAVVVPLLETQNALKVVQGSKDAAAQTKTALYEMWSQFQAPDGVIASMIKGLLLMTMHQMLAKITNDTVAWINGGGKGEIRILQNPEKFLSDALDEATGEFIGTLLGVDSRSLCNADYLKYTLRAELAGPFSVPTFNEKVQCTFSGMASGLQKFQEDFRNGGWTSFIQILDKPNNDIGVTILAMEEKQRLETTKVKLADDSIGRNGGYLDQEACVITKLPEEENVEYKAREGDTVEVAMTKENLSDYTKKEFIAMWKSWGGDVACTITTPAQNIKNIVDKTLEGPLLQIGQMSASLTANLGKEAGSILQPYLNAILTAGFNKIMSEGKGLITNFLAQQSKPRQIRRQPTNTLQRSAEVSQATTTLVGSASDFRSFLLSAALEFSQFIALTGTFFNENEILGYRALNRYNYNSDGASSGKTWDGLVEGQFGPGDQGSEPGTQYRDTGPTVTPAATACNLDASQDSICYPSTKANDTGGTPARNYFTQTAGRTFFEEARWCGAYSQTLPTATNPPSIIATSPVANPIPILNQPFGGCANGVTSVYNTTTGSNVNACAAAVDNTDPYNPIYTCPANQTVENVDGKMVCKPNVSTMACPALTTITMRTWRGSSRSITLCAPLPLVPITLTGADCPVAPAGLTSDCTVSPWVQYMNGGNTVMASRLIGYDDNGSSTSTETIINRFVRESIVGTIGTNGMPGTISLTSPINFTETIINTGRDENQNGATDTTLQSLEYGTIPQLKEIFEMRPNYVNTINPGGSLVRGLAQTTTATTPSQTFVFGGYNEFGFSDLVLNGAGTYTARLPIPLAGAAAAYNGQNGRIYIFGGFNQSGMSDKIFEFNPSTNQFRTMSAHLVAPSLGFSAAYFPKNQRIYLFGGINNGELSNQILEYNQTTDTLSLRNTTLPAPLAYSGAATVTVGPQNFIEIAGGEYGPGIFSADIFEYNPLASDSLALTRKPSQLTNTVAFPVVTVDSANKALVYISGGQNRNGYSSQSWTFNASTGVVTRTSLASPLTKAGGNGSAALYGGITSAPDNTAGAKIYPQGDVFVIPGDFPKYPTLPQAPSTMSPTAVAQYIADYNNSMNTTSGVRAISVTETFYEKYQSPTIEGASALLINHRQSVDLADPTGTIINPIVLRKINNNPNQTHLSPPFYPELYEIGQELMEKIRLINGYNQERADSCYDTATLGARWSNYYQASLAEQLGAAPDDNPADNNPASASYSDAFDYTVQPPKLICEGYKGSVNDVLSRYNNVSGIYQKLFAGLHDENSLEAVDKDFKILSPEETNIRLALIGTRCPIIPPSLTSSSADLVEKCPVLSSGEYNMSRRFVFEPDDTTTNPTGLGLTTGFATNPFSGKKSSALAGILNLEEMTTQLQTLPPDKNIIKLIRLRQILEGLQVWRSINPVSPDYQKAIRDIPLPDKSNAYITSNALTGVDTIQVSLNGFDKIQDWLNATSTPSGTPLVNEDIQDLISAYGYTTAKEAYPQISKELDDIFPVIINQVSDKMKAVFLKRIELEMEDAQINAQNRLEKFVSYARDMNPIVKYESKGTEGSQMQKRFSNDTIKIGYDDYVLQVNATDVFKNGGKKINDFLERKPSDNSTIGLTEEQRNGVIGSAIYKIRTMARFIGIDVNSIDFSNRLTHYTQEGGATETERAADLDSRVRDVLRDVAMYYQGIFNQTDPSVSLAEQKLIPAPSPFGCSKDSAGTYYCDLTTISGGINGKQSRIYTDVKTQLTGMSDNFGEMVNELSKIKEEYQLVVTGIKTKKGSMDGIIKLFGAMKNDYNQANACVGLQNPESARWQPSKDVLLLFGAVLGGGIGASFVVDLFYGIGGGAIIGAIASVFGLGKDSKKAAEEARARWQRAVNSCKEGFVNYNKHLGQIADQFLCGKINSKYQD